VSYHCSEHSCPGKTLLNQQLGKKVYTKLVMVIERVVNFATSKNLTVKNTMFHIPTSINMLGQLQMGKPHNRIDHILVDR
jgi:hypothetical protein